ncbi:MAG: ISKra4 family transposase, partial [Acidimicrobiales bacterium]
MGRVARGGAEGASGLEAFWNLERFLSAAASERLGMAEIERGSEQRGREIVRALLQAHLDGRGDGDVGPAIVLAGPGGAVRLGHRRSHTRRLLTLFGEVTVTRVGYGAPGHDSVHPLDAELQLPARAYSYEICRRLVRAAVCGPFDEAVALVADTTGVAIPKRSAEQLVLEAAADFNAFYASRATAEVAVGDGEVLVGAIDGKGIPMVKPEGATRTVRLGKGKKRNKKRMATVGAVFAQAPLVRSPEAVVESLFSHPAQPPEPRPPRQRPAHKRVWASLLAGKDTFIADVKAEMTRRDPAQDHPWVIVTDGERALQKRVGALFEDVTLVLDLLHVLEKLWAVAYVFHPEGSPQAEAFVRQRALRILSGQVSGVVQGLRQMVTKRQLKGTKAKTLLDVAGYYYRNRSRMRYDHYLSKGWPIASGSVEGACKNLIKDRMERSGMRWTPEMAEAM